MKKYFLTGLAVVLPVLLTILILQLLLKLLTAPFEGFTETIILTLDQAEWLPRFFHSPDIIRFLSKILLLISLFLLVVFVGFLGKLFLINTLFKLGDKLIHSVPFANKIYKAVQDVIHNLMNEEKPSFTQVVEVPFPHEEALALGFITKEEEPLLKEGAKETFMSVFIPGTPNPLMGFVVLIPTSKVKRTVFTVEQAVKFIVSCGVISPTVQEIGSPDALLKQKTPSKSA